MIDIDIVEIYSRIYETILQLGELPPQLIFLKLFTSGGWLVILLIFIWALYSAWLNKKREKFIASQKYLLLTINVPRENIPNPEAMERTFAQIAVISPKISFINKYFRGHCYPTFSFELVALQGSIQFFIRTPEACRDLVEAALYATYTGAEILEVKDYTEEINPSFPNENYDLWGSDLVLYNKAPYPIKTYLGSEQFLKVKPEEYYWDPFNSLLEILSRLTSDEHLWLQLILVPAGKKWLKEGADLVEKLMALPAIKPGDPSAGPMSPGKKNVVEAIQKKLSKIAFKVKFRMIYLAPKASFSVSRGAVGVLGAINSFNTLDMNGLAPAKWAKTAKGLIFKKRHLARQQNAILKAYKSRDYSWGGNLCLLNIEELATLYHLPTAPFKAPLIKRVSFKRGEPPIGLPTQ